MKKVLLVVAAAGFLLATPSCKKGVNDPAMSLSSRKARLAGEWKVVSTESTSTSTDSDGDISATTESNNGSTITSTWSETEDGVTVSGIGSAVITVNAMEYIFNKDGTWSSVFNKTAVSSSEVSGVKTVETKVTTENVDGQWSFLGKNKGNYKNKERVEILPTKTVSTSKTTTVVTASEVSITTEGNLYTSTDNTTYGLFRGIYDIDMLKGKEMVWKIKIKASGENTSLDGDGVSVTTKSSSDVTYEIKFEAKSK